MNVLWETMIDEMRAVHTELDNRRHFTAEKETIRLAREIVAEWTEPEPVRTAEAVATSTALSLAKAAGQGLIEVG